MFPSNSRRDPVTNPPTGIPLPPPNSDLQRQQYPPIPQSPPLSARINYQSCAACKHQRRRCTPDCILSEFFPADKMQTFLEVSRLFGVGNLAKNLKKIDPLDRNDAVLAIIYEAEARRLYPIDGCHGLVMKLSKCVGDLKEEIARTKNKTKELKKLLAMQCCGLSDDVLADGNCGDGGGGTGGCDGNSGGTGGCDGNGGGNVMVGPPMEGTMMIEQGGGLTVEGGFDQTLIANIGNDGYLFDTLTTPFDYYASDPMAEFNPGMEINEEQIQCQPPSFP